MNRGPAIYIGKKLYDQDHNMEEVTRVMNGPGKHRKMPSSVTSISSYCSGAPWPEESCFDSDESDVPFLEEEEADAVAAGRGEEKEEQELVAADDDDDQDFNLQHYHPLPSTI